jgi:hypothetical protein
MLGSNIDYKKIVSKKTTSIVVSRELLSTMLLILVLLVTIKKGVTSDLRSNKGEITSNQRVNTDGSYSKVILYRDFDISNEESINFVAASIKHLLVSHDLSATIISSHESIKDAEDIGENIWSVLKQQQAPLQYVRVLTSTGQGKSIRLILYETKIQDSGHGSYSL